LLESKTLRRADIRFDRRGGGQPFDKTAPASLAAMYVPNQLPARPQHITLESRDIRNTAGAQRLEHCKQHLLNQIIGFPRVSQMS
jgi:hypothetical protein